MHKFLLRHCVCGLSFEGQLPLATSTSVSPLTQLTSLPALATVAVAVVVPVCATYSQSKLITNANKQPNRRAEVVKATVKLFKPRLETICLLSAPPKRLRMKIIIKRIKNN